MYFLLDNDPDLRFEDVEEAAAYIYDDDYFSDSYGDFDEWFNEVYGSIDIAGQTFMAADILHDMDDDGYLSEFRSWQESCLRDNRDDAIYELNRMSPDESQWIGSYHVFCYEEEEEEEEWEDTPEETPEYNPQTRLCDYVENMRKQAEAELKKKQEEHKNFEELFQTIE